MGVGLRADCADAGLLRSRVGAAPAIGLLGGSTLSPFVCAGSTFSSGPDVVCPPMGAADMVHCDAPSNPSCMSRDVRPVRRRLVALRSLGHKRASRRLILCERWAWAHAPPPRISCPARRHRRSCRFASGASNSPARGRAAGGPGASPGVGGSGASARRRRSRA